MLLAFAIAVLLAAADTPPQPLDEDPVVSLGQRVFHDPRFSSPSGDMTASCASCHMPADPQGDRAFTEFLARSWHPWRNEDPGRDTLRNSPTLFDVAHSPRLHYDGEFASLEEQSAKTLVGRNLGWLPTETDAALERLRSVVTSDPDYNAAISATHNDDLASLTDDQVLNTLANGLAAFMRTLESPRNTPYDEFIAQNALDEAPATNESPTEFGARLLGEIDRLNAFDVLKRPSDFSDNALEGLRIFLRSEGTARAGNCVACHVPPHFTDFNFHNTGVTQDGYDKLHGAGSFAALAFDTSTRPAKYAMSIANRRKPELIDLGFWNFAPEDECKTALAAFKTPTLRHLASTAPYMHDGAYGTIEHAIEQKIEAAFLTRQHQLRNPDPALAKIHISEDDVPLLFAFLNTLNERTARIAPPRTAVSPDTPSNSYNPRPSGDPRDYVN